jgi:hypothetical protein
MATRLEGNRVVIKNSTRLPSNLRAPRTSAESARGELPNQEAYE